mmetsp:Transcript_16323/g.24194  ORF Transcript_16323/g.24194 Transcript_16323/m.24194 type:complete len:138 (-) Transcript_16323:777-1190(-)
MIISVVGILSFLSINRTPPAVEQKKEKKETKAKQMSVVSLPSDCNTLFNKDIEEEGGGGKVIPKEETQYIHGCPISLKEENESPIPLDKSTSPDSKMLLDHIDDFLIEQDVLSLFNRIEYDNHHRMDLIRHQSPTMR